MYKQSILSPLLERRPLPQMGGFGVFARAPIARGSLLCVFGGAVVDGETLATLPDHIRTHGLQVDDDAYMLPADPFEDAEYFNHSCAPNAGFRGQITLVAMRDIAADEHVAFDYAMCDSDPYDEFRCACGTASCRGQVRGDDWTRPELQERYRGYFSTYLEQRIRG